MLRNMDVHASHTVAVRTHESAVLNNWETFLSFFKRIVASYGSEEKFYLRDESNTLPRNKNLTLKFKFGRFFTYISNKSKV